MSDGEVTVRAAVEADLPAITHLFNVLIPTTATAWVWPRRSCTR